MTSRLQSLLVVAACVWPVLAAPPVGDLEEDAARPRTAQETKQHEPKQFDPFIPVPPDQRRTTRPARVSRNGYVSVQVNIDANGNNIAGDAANEPSIAVDPTNPARIAIGWRQFNSVQSNFRQSGWAYTTDGGQTWTFPGSLTPGTFGSDPVLVCDADGAFYYASINDAEMRVARSFDGGAHWGTPIRALAGFHDKEWMAVDTTDGIGRGNIYLAWTDQLNFTRSTDGGLTYMEPVALPLFNTLWGTMSVGPDGELYIVDVGHGVAKSTNAQDPNATPSFVVTAYVGLGGQIVSSAGPNPGGLLGQTSIATDRSDGPSRGNVYMLGSVNPPGDDPLDVMFARSTDGGVTWSYPVRVNDDPVGTNAWQWFGTMSVAPDGRIDVIWNDTRNDPVGYESELRYSYSLDTGLTWSPSLVLTPSWDPLVGWPNQNKIGDYYDMVSDEAGANIAYSATFNGEQDLYFLRVGDCNGNGVHDGVDIASSTSNDENGNGVPDECEDCNENGTPDDMDIAAGTSQDCNGNTVPDECDLADGTSSDTNGDGVPDECSGCVTAELTRMLSPGSAYGDAFGSSVALDGDVAVVGANKDDDNGDSSGSAYVFRYDGTAWNQQTELLPGDGAAGDLFGRSVAICGNTIVAGAHGDTVNGANSGSAYVFHFDGNAWNEQAKLIPGDGAAGDRFGWSVAIDRRCAIIGAYSDDDQGENAGSAYVFRYDGENWVEEAKLLASDGAALDNFGICVSLSGDVALIGAFGDSGHALDAGTAYVFRYDGQNWNEEAKLMASDGGNSDGFGWAVSVAGDTAVIGASRDDDQGYEAGSAYVFVFDGAQWIEEAKLLPGAGGGAYDRFGCAVATSGDVAVIGAREYLDGARGPGAAYVFARQGTEWFKAAKLLASDGVLGDRLGTAVAISGTTAAAGAEWATGSADGTGAVYVLRGVSDCNETGTLDLCDIADGTSADANGNGVPDECEGPGDLNCDGVVNLVDVDPFVLALISAGNADPFDAYRAAYPYCDPLLGDINADGSVNTFDIDPFVDLLTGG